MDGSGGYHPEWGNLITKEHRWYALTDKWKLAQKLRISKIQFSKHMKLKKKGDQSVDTLPLPRMGNKIPMEEVTETKFRAKREGKTIQRQPHPGIHSIYNHQTQTLLWKPTRAYWEESDIAISWEALLLPDKYKSGCSQPLQSTGSLNEGARETTQEAEGVCSTIGGTTIWTNQYPQSSINKRKHMVGLMALAAYVAEYGLVSHQWEVRLLVLWRLYAPV